MKGYDLWDILTYTLAGFGLGFAICMEIFEWVSPS